MVDEVQRIIDSICIDEDIPEAFTSKGFDYKELDTGEDNDSFSTNVNWNLSLEVQKDSKKFKVYLSGTASANISYDRWTTTDCYVIDYSDIEEIK